MSTETTTAPRQPDELDALTRVAEMRAILSKAGRWDLADLAWAHLCPSGVPITVRRDALIAAGYVAQDHPNMSAYREGVATAKGETVSERPELPDEELDAAPAAADEELLGHIRRTVGDDREPCGCNGRPHWFSAATCRPLMTEQG